MTTYYFVDEAGDSTIYNREKKSIVGQMGCSKFFIMGLLYVIDPPSLEQDLRELRNQLLADPELQNKPSMLPSAKKTALLFHAKDDLPPVRQAVFEILQKHQQQLQFFAVIRDKTDLLNYITNRNKYDKKYRYNPNELYDTLVTKLFKDRLHKDEQYYIEFAKRGGSDRTQALESALQEARKVFQAKWNINSTAPISVKAVSSQNSLCLQAVDYFNWALQRMYERQEENYLQQLWPSFRLVIDLDDIRVKGYGVYYTQKKPLTLVALSSRVIIKK